jgi:hypothetical protein
MFVLKRKHLAWMALTLVVMGLIFSGAGHVVAHDDEDEHCEECALAFTSPPIEPVVVLQPSLAAELAVQVPDGLLVCAVPVREPARGPPSESR